MTPNIALQITISKLCKILVFAVIILSLFTLLGWFFVPSLLVNTTIGNHPLRPSAALSYIFIAIAYLLLTNKHQNKTITLIARCLISIVLIGSIVVFINNRLGIDTFIDPLLSPKELLNATFIIPMPSLILFCYVINCIGLLLINYETENKRIPAQILSILAASFSWYLFLEMFYYLTQYSRYTPRTMTSFLAILFNLILPFIIFFAQPDKFIAAEFSKTKTGSKSIFLFLPISILAPLIIGWLHLNVNYLNSYRGLYIMVFAFAMLLIIIAYINLKVVNKSIESLLVTKSALQDSIKDNIYFTKIVERSTDAIMFIDENYIIRKWNKGAERVYGYTEEEVIGKNKYELLDAPHISPDQFNEGVKLLWKNGGERTSIRLQSCKEENKTLTILQSTVAILNEQGEREGYVAIGKDITELTEKDRQLELLNAKLQEQVTHKTNELSGVYERISDAVASLDNNWCYTYLNEKGKLFFKNIVLMNESLIGKNIWDTFPFLVGTETDMAYHWSAFKQESFRIEIYYKQFNIWTEQTIYPSPEGISIFLRDITEQKKAEFKQKEAEEKYKQIVETAQEGILIRDNNGIIIYINDYLAKLLQYPNKEAIIGMPLLDLLSGDNKLLMVTNMDRRHQGLSDKYDMELPVKDGSLIYVSINSSPYYDKGEIVGSLSMISDITEKKNAEKELRRTNELYSVLSKTTQLMVVADSVEKLFHDVCKILIENSDLKLAFIGKQSHTTNKVEAIASYGEAKAYINSININNDDSPEGIGPTGTSIKQGKEYICNDFFADENTKTWQTTANQFNIKASAAFPITFNNTVYGALTVYSGSVNYFQHKEIELLKEITLVISMTMEKLWEQQKQIKAQNDILLAKEEWERTFNAIPDLIAILDNNHNIVRANKAMADKLNLNTENIVGQKCYTLMHGTDCPIGGCPHTQLLIDGQMHNANLYEPTLGVHLDITTSPIHDKKGNILGSVHIARDVSVQKNAEKKIKQLADIIEHTNAFVSISNLDRTIVYLNNAARIGMDILPTDDITNMSVNDFHTEETNLFNKNTILPALIENGIWMGENEWISLKGNKIQLIQVIMLHRDENGAPEYTSSTAIDISEIKNKEADLIKLSEDLRALTSRLMIAREEERKNIAKELHDELGQNLTAIKLNLSWVSSHLDDDRTLLNERLQQFNLITDETVHTSRKLYNSLYPQMLDEVGIIGAIKWHSITYLKAANIDFDLQTNLENNIFPEYHDIWLVIYRTYQECITNILRYARANLIIVELYKIENQIELIIQDDGIGFELDKVDTKMHHGLLGMRERVFALNGIIHIQSSLGKGTTTTVKISI